MLRVSDLFRLRSFYGKVIARNRFAFPGSRHMSAVARKLEPKPRLKTFHASLLVTRLEQWWVEAETAEEAQALLASGQGHHCELGERVYVEVEGMLEEAG